MKLFNMNAAAKCLAFAALLSFGLNSAAQVAKKSDDKKEQKSCCKDGKKCDKQADKKAKKGQKSCCKEGKKADKGMAKKGDCCKDKK